MEEQGGSSSGQRDGAVAARMEGALEGLLVHRGPSHPPSTLAGRRDGHTHTPPPAGVPRGTLVAPPRGQAGRRPHPPSLSFPSRGAQAGTPEGLWQEEKLQPGV